MKDKVSFGKRRKEHFERVLGFMQDCAIWDMLPDQIQSSVTFLTLKCPYINRLADMFNGEFQVGSCVGADTAVERGGFENLVQCLQFTEGLHAYGVHIAWDKEEQLFIFEGVDR